MSVDGIRRGLVLARGDDGKVDAKEVDRILLEARDGGGVDAAERNALAGLFKADDFDDAAKERLGQHLSLTGQKAAHVSMQVDGAVKDIQGRYADMKTNVPGLNAKLGLFDNTFSLSGKAKADGVLNLSLDGKAYSVKVAKGDTPATILANLQKELPKEMTGYVFGGDVRPYEAESFEGTAPRADADAAHITFFKPGELGLKPGEKPLRVVVTGYGPFQTVRDNPSDTLARQLAEKGAPGAIVEYRRLDVTQSAVDKFMAEMENNPPDIIFSMGTAGSLGQDAQGQDILGRIESAPRNNVTRATDGEGKPTTPGKIDPNKPLMAELKTDLPVDSDAVKRALAQAPSIRVSTGQKPTAHDRSDYLCNYLGYKLADAFGGTPETTAGFMHIADKTTVDPVKVLLDAVVSRQLEEWRKAPVPRS